MPKEVVLISAVSINGFIARHSHEVISWTKDLKLFKKQTMGHVVIVGLNTYKTLPSTLPGRTIIKIGRNSNPDKIIKSINSKRCFVIGGGKTFSKFAPYLTHLYITPHPYVFNGGVMLFETKVDEMKLIFKKHIVIDKKNGIFQFQYQIKKQ